MSYRNFSDFSSLTGLSRLAFAFASALATGLMSSVPAWAQMPTPARAADSRPKPSEPATLDNLSSIPAGQGAGVHGANSPFSPLSARDDVVAWSVLTAVKTTTANNRVLPVFTTNQLALHQKTQRIQGFMMPLDPGATQRHFLLSSVPLTCAFCLPGGPESMEPVVVEGRFQVLNDDAFGMYYRMLDASSVK